MKTPAPTAEPLIDNLAARIARRDLPPPLPTEDPYAPAQVRARLLAAVALIVPRGNIQSRRSQTKMLYQFLEHEARTAADLAAAAGLGRIAGSRAHTRLVQAGLLHSTYGGRCRAYRLTRWGEDWLLAVARAEAVPPRPAASAPIS